MEFGEIAEQAIHDEFVNLAKAAQSMSPDETEAYKARNPIAIWTVAGPSQDHAIAISLN